MTIQAIEQREIRELRDFYDLMAQTRQVRRGLVQQIWSGEAPGEDGVQSLRAALANLEAAPLEGGKRVFALDGEPVQADLSYEISELKKDIHYLAHGEDALLALLGEIHEGFQAEVDHAMEIIAGRGYKLFVTDRDGTVNNYCARYRSSVQSVYNAVFLSRFAKARTETSIILTSAPLANPGIVDISTAPDQVMVYAASKGRECVGLDGRRRHVPIDQTRQKKLDELNQRLGSLVEDPAFEKFALIGSGLQFKFGQTTVARQDIARSVSAEESFAMLQEVGRIVRDIDPDHKWLVIEDTGMDVEILLTVGDAEGGLKDFDKGDGVAAVAAQLGLDMARGPQLVCGDTNSDVPMLVKVHEHCPDTRGVFVTRDPVLADKVRVACKNSVVVSEPDALVAALGRSTLSTP